MKEKRLNEIQGVVVIAAGLIVLASLLSFTPFDLPFYTAHPYNPPHNVIRTFGAYFAGALFFLFGWAAYLIPALALFLGARLFQHQRPDLRIPRLLGMSVLLISTSALLGVFYFRNAGFAFSRAGFLGFAISNFVGTYFGRLGGYIIFITLIMLSLALVTEALISSLLFGIGEKTHSFFSMLLPFRQKEKSVRIKPLANTTTLKVAEKPKIKVAETPLPKVKASEPAIQIKTKPQGTGEPKVRPQELKIGDYHLPSLDLLTSPPPFEARQIKEDLQANAKILEETLEDFGISAKVTDIERGPVITRYELDPAPGVKINRIVTLSDDISLAMKAQSVRIIAPIPGKGRVGVEVPNNQSTLVFLKEVLASQEFQETKTTLPMALGKDITGRAVVADLDDMPHLLIAGTTGSGKTVCVNSLILSFLFKKSPNELKFLMVDPKMVELMPFNGLPHLLCPVVTEAKKASMALNWVVSEMEERYRLLAKVAARNIEAYNEKVQENKLPYIIVIVDEFADLMTVARDQIESAITRLAQLSRAVGIHLLLATQRPSVDVITGVIKANLPARVSFKVASKVDSRTVLDMNGADKLLGKGDMLFLKPGEAKPARIQGTLVEDAEIERVVEFIKAQAQPVYNEAIVKEQEKSGMMSGDKDDVYDEAIRVVMESNQASASILQRRLRLGYARAARIIDMMEADGLVGPFEGSKPRRILIDRDEWLQKSMGQKEQVES